jgi:hypothetical protein
MGVTKWQSHVAQQAAHVLVGHHVDDDLRQRQDHDDGDHHVGHDVDGPEGPRPCWSESPACW